MLTEFQIQALEGMLASASVGADLRNSTWQGQYKKDVALCLRHIKALEGVIHDLQQDQQAYSYGYDACLASLAGVASEVRGKWLIVAGYHNVVKALAEVELAMNAGRITQQNSLPPAQLRAENDRLRGIIREAREELESSASDGPRGAWDILERAE